MRSTHLNRHNGTALYRQLSEIIEARLQAGEYPPGRRLPSLLEFADEFGVNRLTVRQALDELARRGVIEVKQGNGTFPAATKVRFDLGTVPSFTHNISAHGAITETRLLDVRTVTDKRIQTELGAAERLVCYELVRYVDGVPWSLTTIWMDRSRLPRLKTHWPSAEGTGSLFDALRDHYDIELRRAYRTYWSELAEPRDADHLDVAVGYPILASEGLDTTQHGEPILFTASKGRGDRIKVTFRYNDTHAHEAAEDQPSGRSHDRDGSQNTTGQ
ncbi:GntR family transcriptional regulator [Streptomyces sp. NPDC001508]|uniref:GntR family transcriptional regulator n=1 Tax=Streptomyces sp. NPDC001508 TaxID=3154656 RepID=UPI00332CEEB3